MNTGVTIRKSDIGFERAFMFFNDVSDLRSLGPGEADQSEYWVAEDDGDIVGMAAVEPESNRGPELGEPVAWVFKLGVRDHRQGEGFGRALLTRLRDEYGVVELEIDSRKDANDFYDHLGMELVQEKYASFHDGTEGMMFVWRWEA